MKNTILLAAGSALFILASCQSPKEKLIGKWQIVSFETPSMDSMAKVRKASVDTITQVDSTMAAFLGTNNVDSVKAIIKERIDDYKTQQKDAATMTSLSFLKDGKAIFHSGPRNDTSTWEIAGSDKLILSPFTDAQREAGATEDTAVIEKLTSNELRLKMMQGTIITYANLRPYTKDDSVKSNEMMEKQKQKFIERMKQAQQSRQPMGANQ